MQRGRQQRRQHPRAGAAPAAPFGSRLPRRRVPHVGEQSQSVAVELNARAFAYHGTSLALAAYEAAGAQQRDHVLIELDQRLGFYASGLQVTFPKPQGMSGAPVWESIHFLGVCSAAR